MLSMEATCSFRKRIAGIRSSDKRCEREVVVPLVSCERDICRHIRSIGENAVQSEVELILARASVFPLQAISQHGPFALHIAPLWGLAGAGEQIDVEFNLVFRPCRKRKRKKSGPWYRQTRVSTNFTQTGEFVPVGCVSPLFVLPILCSQFPTLRTSPKFFCITYKLSLKCMTNHLDV